MSKPYFTIVIPTYNRADFLIKAISSVFQQTYTNYEIIVVDDGSTDNTEEVIKSITDHRLIYLKKENGERGMARNYGTKNAKGTYVNFFDSDDLLYPNHLSVAFECITNLTSPDLLYLNYDIKNNLYTTKKNGAIIKGKLNSKLLCGNLLSCNGVFVKKYIALQFPFSEERKLSGTEDWLLWLRLASRYPFNYSNTITSTVIQHSNRSVLSFDENQMHYRTELLVKELSNDTIFMKKWGLYLPSIKAHMLSYTALHLALSKKSKKALLYLQKSIILNKVELFSLRTFATLKLVTQNYFNLR